MGRIDVKADLAAAHKYLSGVYGNTADVESVVVRDLRRMVVALLIVKNHDASDTAKELRALAEEMDPVDLDIADALLDRISQKP